MARLLHAVVMFTPAPRAVPRSFTAEGRRSYLEIARHAQNEAVNAYTLACLGMQAYLQATYLLQAHENQICPNNISGAASADGLPAPVPHV